MDENRDQDEQEVADLLKEAIRKHAEAVFHEMLPEIKKQIKSELREEIESELREEFKQQARLSASEVQMEMARQAVISAGIA